MKKTARAKKQRNSQTKILEQNASQKRQICGYWPQKELI